MFDPGTRRRDTGAGQTHLTQLAGMACCWRAAAFGGAIRGCPLFVPPAERGRGLRSAMSLPHKSPFLPIFDASALDAGVPGVVPFSASFSFGSPEPRFGAVGPIVRRGMALMSVPVLNVLPGENRII